MENRENAVGAHAAGLDGAIVAICVGNTRTRLGVISAGQIEESRSISHADLSAVVRDVSALKAARSAGAVVIASVNRPVSLKLEMELASAGEVFVVGRDLDIPIRHALDDASTVGQDRLLDAVAAFARLKEACIVADLGTAITIDFVDGEGAFHGGVIAPGVRAMMRAMHASASALPELDFEVPDPARGPFGKDTAHAMRLGVRNAVLGLLRQTVEQFSEKFGAFPTVIATGGDAGIVADDPMVDRVVPDLQMLGVAEVCRVALAGGTDEPPGDD